MIKNLLVIVLIATLNVACGNRQHYSAIPPKATVVILGDSLTYGTGAGQGQGYVNILASNTGWSIINAGVPGNTSSDGLERLPDILDDHKIDLLIIELGGNDFLKRLPEAETTRNLNAILAQVKARKIQAVLLAIPEFSPISAAFGNLSDHPLYEKLAKETNTPLVENIFSDVLADNNLKADPIHPNAEGYRVIEGNLRKSLIKMGFLSM